MAPGRPVLSVGIQPQIALYTIILGSVSAFGWYTEKYRRDEGEIENHLQKLYIRNVQESRSKMPQMAAALRGQSTDLDGRMDNWVWGGKAKLKNGNSGGNGDSNGTEALASTMTDDENENEGLATTSRNEEKRKRRRRKQKRKKNSVNDEDETAEQQKKLILQSSIAGVAVGAVTVAAVSVLLSGGSAIGGRK